MMLLPLPSLKPRPRAALSRMALVLAAPLLLPACMSLAPPYAPAALPVPPLLDGAPGADAPLAPLPTDLAQAAFVQEPRLRALLGLALADNRDLRVAVLAVERARAQYGIAQAERLPTLNASASASRTGSAEDLTAAGRSSTAGQYSAGVGLANFELDFWGRVRNLNEAALQEFLRSEDNRASARISLASEVMLTWLALDADARRLQLARATLRAREQQLDLTRRSHALGATSGLTLAQVQTTVDSARLDIATYQAQVARGRNALGLLAGAPVPGNWLPPAVLAAAAQDTPSAGVGAAGTAGADAVPARSAKALPAQAAAGQARSDSALTAPVTALPEVPADLPSSVLLARPDVRAAEHTLQASHAQIGVARAAFYPSISLTASAGTASNALTGLFAGGNGTWALAPQLRLPIFDAGRNRANLRVAELARETALAQYERAIQSAFREVLDALADRAVLGERLAAQRSLLQATQRAFDLSEARFRLGADSYLGVLDAQRSLYGAQQGLIALEQAEQANRVALFRALGGQWRSDQLTN